MPVRQITWGGASSGRSSISHLSDAGSSDSKRSGVFAHSENEEDEESHKNDQFILENARIGMAEVTLNPRAPRRRLSSGKIKRRKSSFRDWLSDVASVMRDGEWRKSLSVALIYMQLFDTVYILWSVPFRIGFFFDPLYHPFIKTRKLAPQLATGVRSYFLYMQRTRSGVEEELILESLPQHYRLQCEMFVRYKSLQRIALFRNREGAFLRAILSSLVKDYYSPNQILIQAGDLEEMTIIAAGEVRIVDEDLAVRGRLTTGNAYAERALFAKHTSPFTLAADSYCEVWTLYRRLFKIALRKHLSRMKSALILAKRFQVNETNHQPPMAGPSEKTVKAASPVGFKIGSTTKHIQLLTADTAASLRGIDSWRLPSSRFRKIWARVECGLLIFLLFEVPYQIAFQRGFGALNEASVPTVGAIPMVFQQFNFGAAMIVEIFFHVDWYFRVRCFVCFADSSSGKEDWNALISEHEEIFRRYKELGDLWMDILANAPIALGWDVVPKEGIAGEVVYYASEHGQKVLDPARIRKRYVDGYFVQDCCSMIPIYFYGDYLGMTLARVPRMLRSPQLITLLDEIQTHIQEHLLRGNTRLSSVFDLCKFILIFVSTAHYLGSLYYLLGKYQLEFGIVEHSWVNMDLILRQYPNNVPVHYMRAMYWCLSTFTVDCFGDILARNFLETVFSGCTCILGWIFVGQVIGRINMLMITLNKDAKLQAMRIEAFDQFAKQRKLPTKLRHRGLESLTYKSECLVELRTAETFRDLPTALRARLFDEMYSPLLMQLPEFNQLSRAQVKAIASVMYLEIYLHGDVIYERGRMGTKLYVLKKGCAEMFSPYSRTVFAALHEGSLFGEFAFFMPGARRLASVRAIRSCQVLQLDRKAWIRIWPEDVRNEVEAVVLPIVKKHYERAAMAFLNITKNFYIKNDKSKPPKTMLFVTLYYIFVIPFRVCFLYDHLDDPKYVTIVIASYVFEYLFTDMVCVIDFFFRRNFFVYLNGGEAVADKEAIKRHYWEEGSYLIDFISLIPFEILGLVVVGAAPSHFKESPEMPFPIWRVLAITRLNRFLRGVHFHSLSDRMQRFLLYEAKISWLQPGSCYLFRLAVDFALGSHWVACLFFGVSFFTYDESRPSWLTAPGMLVFEGCRNLSDVSHLPLYVKYVRSFHFSIGAITTVCYGDIIPMNAVENVTTMVVIFLSVGFFSMLSGGFFKYYEMDLGKRADYEEKVSQVGDFMVFHQFPSRMWKQMQVYFALRWQESKGMQEEEMLQGLTSSVRDEIVVHVHANLLKHVKLLQSCEPCFARALVTVLQHELFVRNDVIIQRGDLGRSMYIIESGLVSIRRTQKRFSTTNQRKTSAVSSKVEKENAPSMPQTTTSRLRRSFLLKDPKALVLPQPLAVAPVHTTEMPGRVATTANLSPVVTPPSAPVASGVSPPQANAFSLASVVKAATKEGKMVKFVKGPFDYFGERSLLFGTPRNATCVALCVCSVYVLTLEKYEEILAEFPMYRRKNIQDWVMDRLAPSSPGKP
ncbi:hypothetical protein Poli38472_014507 [Pythium oligandrum]|uniref:Cyclic nucleotide-binding domain-containing protein n=1 Tax=Pythium oligandrum TaxID=41045 RepID=A0A8K1CDT7_PYTOL|nr:hypothetical protein Poli38472_014507 [Pythium oligandrum]|eukprot:TMW61046.1 hypothetical protein Poli38472_014507 [Pythium oligandrum]